MDNFKMIYKILKILEKSMDVEEFDNKSISKERLELSEARWCRIIAILVKEGYITGIDVWNAMDCPYPRVAVIRPEITLKGLEYLNENSIMKKAANLAKGISDIMP
ncbi:YjcQ family protein [Clostridium sp. LP20]|uniref:YjcQ family protein n=1 Tax=Clostridium sp. LP20 TaxID=3418665 RepID=UPI003EE49CDB